MAASPTTRNRARGVRAGGGDPPLLAITGGIGSGKSTALQAFAELGAATLSSDEVVARAYDDPEVVGAVRDRFGPEVVSASGAIDRAALGRVAFEDAGGLAFLESVIHPRVAAARQRWVEARGGPDGGATLLVCEVPLLFEVGLEDDFDAVLVVTAPEAVRRERVGARGQDFDRRKAHQTPEAEKVARADEAFVNDGSEDDLARWAAGVYEAYARGAP